MAVPPYPVFIEPVFRLLASHNSPVPVGEACEHAATVLGITDDDRLLQVKSGGPVYKNRVSWALNWLKRAGLAEAPTLGQWQLTAEGRKLALAKPILTPEVLSRFDPIVTRRKTGSPAGGGSARAAAVGSSSPRDARKAYRLPARPLASGGQADVFVAERKADRATVIFKRTRSKLGPNRMRREIEVQSTLDHPNIMPILDWDRQQYTWYVMPIGIRVMSEIQRPLEQSLLRRIVEALLAALETAHSRGHPHRDIKPQNVIELVDEQGNSRWVLADWGLTRRAPGNTTAEWTKTGQLLGTEGFAPPEAYRDAHNVGVLGDIYALGQLIAWASGVDPVPNQTAVVPGAWGNAVEEMTRQDPVRRPQCVADVRHLMVRSSSGVSAGG